MCALKNAAILGYISVTKLADNIMVLIVSTEGLAILFVSSSYCIHNSITSVKYP